MSDEFAPDYVINNTFRVIRKLGEGGMGQVYLAENLVDGSHEAIKTISPAYANNEIHMEYFRRGAAALRNIKHPAVVSYQGLVRDERGNPYLVMEYVEGESLANYVKRHGALPDSTLCALGITVARGLHAAHSIGIVHRDISPDNIVLRNGDVSKPIIIDFGIAKLTRDEAGSKDIELSRVVGRQSYMAPEQAGFSGGRIDGRTDIYALGIVLFEAWTGTRFESTESHSHPSPLGQCLRSMRAQLPDERPASMVEVETRLVDALDATFIEDAPTKRFTTIPPSVGARQSALGGSEPTSPPITRTTPNAHPRIGNHETVPQLRSGTRASTLEQAPNESTAPSSRTGNSKGPVPDAAPVHSGTLADEKIIATTQDKGSVSHADNFASHSQIIELSKKFEVSENGPGNNTRQWNGKWVYGAAAVVAIIAGMKLLPSYPEPPIPPVQPVPAVPEVAKRTDAELELDIRRRLAGISALSETKVTVKRGVAVLQGATSDARAATRAAESVEKIPEIASVINQIALIAPPPRAPIPPPNPPPAPVIAPEIWAALFSAPICFQAEIGSQTLDWRLSVNLARKTMEISNNKNAIKFIIEEVNGCSLDSASCDLGYVQRHGSTRWQIRFNKNETAVPGSADPKVLMNAEIKGVKDPRVARMPLKVPSCNT